MPDRLPPLTALRAFEAAARHMSFARAADELAVTPAALSYQIRSLEEHLGAPVFRRLNRAVELTEAGRTLQRGTAEGFDNLRRAWRATRRLGETATLTVTAGPAFTAKWLAPRLFGFAEAHPEIDLRLAATLRILDFERDEVDIAIRFGSGGDDGLFSEVLYEGFVTPMMHPRIAARISEPADLLGEKLIHDDSLDFMANPPGWAAWFTVAGVAHGALRGTHFSQADHAIDMALEGAGVVMGRSSITTRALRDGTLVAPFNLAITVSAHYRIVCLPGTETRPAIAKFRDWAHAEVAKDAPLAERFEKVHIA